MLKTGYRIDVSEDGMVWQGLVRNTGLTLELGTSSSHRYDHEGLTPGDRRYYRVLANDGGIFSVAGLSGEGIAGEAENPGKTRSLSADLDANDPTQINVSWSGLAADETGGAKIRRYLVEVSADGTDWIPDVADSNTVAGLDAEDRTGYVWVDASKTSYQHKGLPANTRYHYRVRADNSANDAGFMAADNLTDDGAAQTATEKTPVPKKPGMPMSLSAHPAADSSLPGVGDRGVYVTWLKPAKVLGGEVTGYNIERRVADEDTLTDSVDGTRTFYQDTDNLVGQVRDYRVSAESDAGSGPWTGWITYPIAEHTHNAAPTTVGTIADVTVMVDGMRTSAMAASSYFSDADGDTLTITPSSSDDTIATAMINTDGMIVVRGVAEGMATITVTATDAAGAYVMQTFMVTVEAAITELTAPENVMAAIGVDDPGQIVITWDEGSGPAGYKHAVALFTRDFSRILLNTIDNDVTGGEHRIPTAGIPDGEYVAVVATYHPDDLNTGMSLGSNVIVIGGN